MSTDPRHYDVIVAPVVTEKATAASEHGKVIFHVRGDATKPSIKAAVEKLFNVKVACVNTLVMRGKDRRMGRGYAKMQNWKKAMVTLKEGHSIDFFAETPES